MTCIHFPAEEFILSWQFLILNYPFLKGFQTHFILSWLTYPSMTVSEPHLSFPERFWNSTIINWRVLGHIYPLLNCSKTLLVSSLMGIWKVFLHNRVNWKYKLVQRSRMCGPLSLLFLYMWNYIRAQEQRHSKSIFQIEFKFHKSDNYCPVRKVLLNLNIEYNMVVNTSIFC